MARKIGPSTTHAELARVLDGIVPAKTDLNFGARTMYLLTPRQEAAIDEAANRARDRVAEGADEEG